MPYRSCGSAGGPGLLSDRAGGLLDFFGTSLLPRGRFLGQSVGVRGFIGEMCDSFRHSC